ncbi:MAG: hypothetical protein QOF33_3858 [Thermomicrobiales bacterium]|jgi:cytoskeletal protein CcmA (bactofilin family)|nr:hypothetical protein [Thermomicrobiales bacterium]MEA2525591.1 hypothetical protein [Thermomicrobiales bacterium]MEA2585773.1 hypothetical protein [Thermomicrobiales bacterium]MEA2597357.1 hypothetical protein [Thermomicrobiales bacterium]
MVFRRDNKPGDAFQRQISALRQQLGDAGTEGNGEGADAAPIPADQPQSSYDAYRAADAATSGQLSGGLGDAVSRAAGYDEYGVYEGSPAEQGVTGEIVPTAPALPELPVVDALTTVIARNTIWKGEISSEGTVHVHGLFEGTIRARQDVYIADQADVDATINANAVVIAGLMKGTIRCSGRFEVLPTGRVTGEIQSPTLVIHEGALVTGQFRMGAGETTPTESQPTPVVQRRATRGSA